MIISVELCGARYDTEQLSLSRISSDYEETRKLTHKQEVMQPQAH